MKHIITQLMVVCVLGFLAGSAGAKSIAVSIPMNDVHAHTGERGTFYVLDVSVPEDVSGNRLDMVVLEFAVDAIASSEEDSVETPVVGVYPITSEFVASRGDGPVGTVEAPETEEIVPSSRPVALGEHRVLRMDITGIVRDWMSEPSSNHGLAIGTLTGPDVGSVTLNETLPGGDAPVRVTFFYRAQ
jgi:hypothetical protein